MRISVENIYKNYGAKPILEGITLHITEKSRIGLIGVNGTGKSTLLRIIAGIEEPDSGTVTVFPGVRVSYLAQTPDMKKGNTVIDQVFANCPPDFRDMNRYEAENILTRLGISEFEKDVSELSGGQRKRVALASAFLRPAEVLILDEPTNHLDTYMTEWLEEKLRTYPGSVIMVTHDRYFLDRTVNTIAELDHAKLYEYEAGYSGFLKLREARLDSAAATERKRQSVLRREYEWITRGAQARTTKSGERIKRYETLLAADAPEEDKYIAITAGSSRMGKKTLEAHDISKSFGGRQIIKPFSYTLLRNDRIGIVGRNGAGKSTLVNMLSGLLAPDSGVIDTGTTLRIGYFRQENEALDPNTRVLDYINDISPSLHTPEGSISSTVMLEKFLFPAETHRDFIGRLSGGERRRLYLLGILMDAPNVLMLDEPTNDLDIETLAILEEYLLTFPGAVIAVSHDRYFLDKLATAIFEVRSDGEVRIYSGSFSDYVQKREPDIPVGSAPAPQKHAPRPEPAPKPTKLRFSFKEQREFDTIDSDIASLEQQIADCEREIEANSSDYVKLEELTALKTGLENELDAKTERWVYLNDLAERIAAQQQ